MKVNNLERAIKIWGLITNEKYQVELPIINLIEDSTYFSRKGPKLIVVRRTYRGFDYSYTVHMVNKLLEGKNVFVSGRYARYTREEVLRVLIDLKALMQDEYPNKTILKLDNGARLHTFHSAPQVNCVGLTLEDSFYFCYKSRDILLALDAVDFGNPAASTAIVIPENLYIQLNLNGEHAHKLIKQMKLPVHFVG